MPTHVLVPSVSRAAVPQGLAGTIIVETPSSPGLARPVEELGPCSANPRTSAGVAGEGIAEDPDAAGEAEPFVAVLFVGGAPPAALAGTPLAALPPWPLAITAGSKATKRVKTMDRKTSDRRTRMTDSSSGFHNAGATGFVPLSPDDGMMGRAGALFTVSKQAACVRWSPSPREPCDSARADPLSSLAIFLARIVSKRGFAA